MWIRVKYRFEDRPHPRQVVVYAPGRAYSVTRRCGEEAIKAGKAVEIPAPTREEATEWQRGG